MLYVSRSALKNLGVIPKNFPRIESCKSEALVTGKLQDHKNFVTAAVKEKEVQSQVPEN